MKRITLWLILLAAVAAAGYEGWRWRQDSVRSAAMAYRTAPVKRSDVVLTISATGTIVPEDVVDVGAQVNGLIAAFGTGSDGKQIDYRSTVTEGMVLARIDETLYDADVASAQAQLSQAQAQVQVNQANLAQANAKLDQSQRDWDRAQKLGPSRSLSQADYDASKSAFEQAQAGVAQANASILQAQASIASADAVLKRARQNVDYCTIKSPVNGVIIDRRVEIGQTVVSSLNAPSLFLIAKDLSRMQVLVQVNEADIGHVKPGDQVTFTSDAFPGDPFTGQVRKVRLNATMTQNVVTYTVEIVTDNSSLKLLPYLTANVRFVADHRDQVLTVPNTALRWWPANVAHPESTGSSRGAAASSDPSAKPGTSGTVWTVGEQGPIPISVRAGLSDGTVTEVTGELHESDAVITGEAPAGGQAGAARSPFTPQLGGRRR